MIAFLKSLFLKKLPQEPQSIPPSREDAPLIFARTFSSADGEKALAYLRALTSRASGPESSEAALRYQDGQRALLQTITGLVEQGRN